ncbi:MAG: ATP-binding protein [Thermodesulfobacteriota bacterium]
MIAAFKAYRIPLFFAVLAMAGLAWWSLAERRNVDAIRREGQRQVVLGLFDLAEGVIEEASWGDDSTLTRVLPVMERLIRSSPLRFVLLEREGKRVLQTPNTPEGLKLSSMEGERFEGGGFLLWRKVGAAKVDPAVAAGRPDGRTNERPKAKTAGSESVLTIGGEFIRDQREYAAALGRMYFTQVLAFFSVAAGFVVWLLTIRSHRLSEQLRTERLRLTCMEDLGLSAAGLAHETKNPLGIISGLAQQVSRDPALSAAGRAKIEQILDEVDKATARLGHFLAYARQRTVQAKALEASKVIGGVAAVLQTEFDAAGVELVLNCPSLRILADEEMLRQILVNLLLNSLNASSEGSRVTVRIGRRGGRAELIVTDNGRGIPPELLPMILRPYVTAKPDGHGLGLAIVKRYVDEHGWTIKIESEAGRGATVAISGIVTVNT